MRNMVLIDTSVWVSHFLETHPDLVELLNDGEVACHPFIVGELACGNLTNRTTILSLLQALPRTI
jgi:predicted nucleic acid-binding protein